MGKKLVIVGGGFAGLSLAKKLSRSSLQITLIDKRNHHLFQPLLYQVATAALSPADIAVPIRAELSKYKNIEVRLAEVQNVNLEKNFVVTDSGDVSYDYLALACGSSHSYFGHDEWESFAPGLKNLEQATDIRKRILLAFEQAEIEKDEKRKEAFLSFAIIGAGPTGVELAGAIAEISRKTFSGDFRHIDPGKSRVFLIEAGARVLAQFENSLSERAKKDLESMGVELRLNSKVTDVNADGLFFGNEFLAAKTIIWAAGVAASPLAKKLNTELDRSGRVKVSADLSLPAYPHVFVLGDMSSLPQPLAALAPVAMQEGRHVARQILRDLKSQAREDFRYVDKGQMATIGHNKAVLQMGKLRMHGVLAWLAWLLVHIYYLISFKNKFFVFINWAWSYLSFKKGARLIVTKEKDSV